MTLRLGALQTKNITPTAPIQWDETSISFPLHQEFDLLERIQTFLINLTIPKKTITAIAVIHGPGRFTPLRTCVVVCKTLSYVLNIPLLPYSSFDVVSRILHPLQHPPMPLLLFYASRKEKMFCSLSKYPIEKKLAPPIEISFSQVYDLCSSLNPTPYLKKLFASLQPPLCKIIFCDPISANFAAKLPKKFLEKCLTLPAFSLKDFAQIAKIDLQNQLFLTHQDKLRLQPFYGRTF